MISGPRQSGKTVLAKSIASTLPASVYLNYDVPAHRARLAERPAFFEDVDHGPEDRPLVVLDEIHKYRGWKNYLKGLYDGYGDDYRFLVTGSGRLDLFQQRGDALAGRYLQFRLFPFTMSELFSDGLPAELHLDDLVRPPDTTDGAQEVLDTLLKCSGFPEPFLKGRETSYRRWAATYHRQVVREDVRDVFAGRDPDAMETLYALLTPRVGSPLSIMQLTDPVKASHKTVNAWIKVFEKLYLVFRVRPYSKRVSRSLLKEPKLYFFDYCRVKDEGKRFENLAAVELKWAVTNWTDHGLGEFDLFFVRNKEQQEVDFLITKEREPVLLVEIKSGDLSVGPPLRKFQNMLGVPAVQLVRRPGVRRVLRNGDQRILVVDAALWLARLR